MLHLQSTEIVPSFDSIATPPSHNLLGSVLKASGMQVRTASWSEAGDRGILERIRRKVFVEEQRVSEEEEFEGLDPEALHLVVELDERENRGEPIGVARLRLTGGGTAKAERFAVLEEHRGRGAGKSLLRAVEDEARRRGAKTVVLSAQLRAEAFYEAHGYRRHGPEFDEAGIRHVRMERRLR
jgi:predicted GNAT family N-acyltransferase